MNMKIEAEKYYFNHKVIIFIYTIDMKKMKNLHDDNYCYAE